MPFAATQMDLEIIIRSEVSQIEKDKYHMISFIYGIQKNDINLFTERDRLTDIENKLMVTKGGRDKLGVWD